MKVFAMGDIHGAYKALLQCLERSGFDYQNDLLIQLGDVADGHEEVYECVEELLRIKNLIAIKGNHDDWFQDFIETDFHPYYWNLGGKGTLISYLNHTGKSGRYFPSGSGFKTALVSSDIPQSHKEFFRNQQLFYLGKDQRCFVHAGFDYRLPFHEQRTESYYWDRSLWQIALKKSANKSSFAEISCFREIYIGHTSTLKSGIDRPMTIFNIHNIDTGAGHSGRLTIMDIYTKEYWQSDIVSTLYNEQH